MTEHTDDCPQLDPLDSFVQGEQNARRDAQARYWAAVDCYADGIAEGVDLDQLLADLDTLDLDRARFNADVQALRRARRAAVADPALDAVHRVQEAQRDLDEAEAELAEVEAQQKAAKEAVQEATLQLQTQRELMDTARAEHKRQLADAQHQLLELASRGMPPWLRPAMPADEPPRTMRVVCLDRVFLGEALAERGDTVVVPEGPIAWPFAPEGTELPEEPELIDPQTGKVTAPDWTTPGYSKKHGLGMGEAERPLVPKTHDFTMVDAILEGMGASTHTETTPQQRVGPQMTHGEQLAQFLKGPPKLFDDPAVDQHDDGASTDTSTEETTK